MGRIDTLILSLNKRWGNLMVQSRETGNIGQKAKNEKNKNKNKKHNTTQHTKNSEDELHRPHKKNCFYAIFV